jgi:protein-disulfide isomerase
MTENRTEIRFFSRARRWISRLPGTTFLTILTLALLPACDGSGGEAQQPPQDPPAAQEGETFDLALLGFNEGNMEESVVWVVEFSDFGCIYCARFHTETYPELYREFVTAGEVAWKYVPVTIAGFPNADVAAQAGICAGLQDNFAPLRDRLFEEREAWMSAENAGPLMQGYARDVGLDEGSFIQCLTGTEAREKLEEANRVARQIGVSGTPTFIVHGFPVQGAPPLDAFQEVLRDLVAQGREGGDR